MFGVVFDYYNTKLKGKQYEQNISKTVQNWKQNSR